MTTPKLAELSPEEKRVLAAEACGFKFVQWSCRKLKGVAITSNGYLVEVPDYGNDLNAMHEAERLAGLHEDSFMGRKLRRIWNTKVRHIAFPQYATAAQRLDAFLLVKGLAQ